MLNAGLITRLASEPTGSSLNRALSGLPGTALNEVGNKCSMVLTAWTMVTEFATKNNGLYAMIIIAILGGRLLRVRILQFQTSSPFSLTSLPIRLYNYRSNHNVIFWSLAFSQEQRTKGLDLSNDVIEKCAHARRASHVTVHQ